MTQSLPPIYTPEELGQTSGFLILLAKLVVCIEGKKYAWSN